MTDTTSALAMAAGRRNRISLTGRQRKKGSVGHLPGFRHHRYKNSWPQRKRHYSYDVPNKVSGAAVAAAVAAAAVEAVVETIVSYHGINAAA